MKFAENVHNTARKEKLHRDKVPMLSFLFIWQFIYSYICCCWKSERYTNYEQTLTIVE